RLVSLDAVHQPRGLAPHAFGLLFVADALLDAEAAEHEQIAHHLMPALVDPPRQQHRPRVVGSEQREALVQQLGHLAHVGDELAVERNAQHPLMRRQLVNRRQVRTEKILIHGYGRKRYPTPRTVRRCLGSPGSFSSLARSWSMKLSMVRVVPWWPEP